EGAQRASNAQDERRFVRRPGDDVHPPRRATGLEALTIGPSYRTRTFRQSCPSNLQSRERLPCAQSRRSARSGRAVTASPPAPRVCYENALGRVRNARGLSLHENRGSDIVPRWACSEKNSRD